MIVLALGLPETGKTLWMHDYIRERISLGYRWLIVDHADEWADSKAQHWRGKAPEITLVSPKDGDPDLEKPGLYVFQNGWNPLDVAALVVKWGNAIYVDDEIDFCAIQSSWADNPLRVVAHQGRHLRNENGEITRCHILGACRRPQSLASDVTQLAMHIAIFRIQGDLTLDRLRRDAHIWDNERERIQTLPQFHYKEWFPAGSRYAVVPHEGAGAESMGPADPPKVTEEKEDNTVLYF